MIKSIIENIYLNNLSLSEQIVFSEKYLKMSDESNKFYEGLKATLNDEQKKTV